MEIDFVQCDVDDFFVEECDEVTIVAEADGDVEVGWVNVEVNVTVGNGVDAMEAFVEISLWVDEGLLVGVDFDDEG